VAQADGHLSNSLEQDPASKSAILTIIADAEGRSTGLERQTQF